MMRFYFFILAVFISGNIFSQDPQFSQYYAAPLYLNPAFAGTTQTHRFIANYRNQWPNIARGFVTTAVSYDVDLRQYNSGIGFMATLDQAGTAGMKSSQLNFLYSYKWNVSSKWVVSAGLNFGYAFRSIDMNKLVFGDQLMFDADGTTPSDDPTLYNIGTVGYFDFNTGVLAYNRYFWFGIAASHLNTPNQSLLEEESFIPVKTSFHGGVRIPLNNSPQSKGHSAILSPSFVYKKQGNFDQLDLGMSLLYKPVMIGLWYRGIPIQQNVRDNLSQDAIIVILGFQFEKFEIGYSYDLTVSDLGPDSGGSHELSLNYHLPILHGAKKKKWDKYVPCPTFMKE
jgi:type IX secretion system PorP/SprF family membrane protein